MNKPEDLGLVPDGAAAQARSAAGPAPRAQAADVGPTARQALRTPAFWIIALSFATFSMLVTGLFFHQVAIYGDRGISSQVASWLFSVSALTMVLAMPVFGRLLDRLPTRPMFAGALLTMTAAMLALVLVQDVPSAIVYAIVFGINNAAIHTHVSYLWPHYFGRRFLGSIQGSGQTFAVVGASIGPIPLGAAYDLFGSYQGALLLSLLPVLCALAVLLMQPPRLEHAAAAEQD